MARPKPPRRAEHGSRIVRALAGLVAAALVLTASIASGSTYFWCAMTQRTVSSCCCAAEVDEAPALEDRGAEVASGCCEARAHRVLPSASPDGDARRLSAPPVPLAMTPAPVARFVGAVVRAPRPAHVERAPVSSARTGPPASVRRAQLQVFHC
jgi:hypothetical protein